MSYKTLGTSVDPVFHRNNWESSSGGRWSSMCEDPYIHHDMNSQFFFPNANFVSVYMYPYKCQVCIYFENLRGVKDRASSGGWIRQNITKKFQLTFVARLDGIFCDISRNVSRAERSVTIDVETELQSVGCNPHEITSILPPVGFPI